MPAQDEQKERKISRRGFVKSAGAAIAAGVVGIELGSTASSILGRAGETTKAIRETRDGRAIMQAPRPMVYAGERVDGASVPPENSFSIFWITDTQFLSETNPALYRMVTNWIVKNWGKYNGKLVIHTGDIVEVGSDETEWENADEAMSILLKNNIPYTWCAGNHDDYTNGDPTSGWIGSQSAPSLDPSTVSGQVNALGYAKWAGDYHQGMNTAISFSTNGLNFLVVNIEWKAQPDVLDWVQGLLGDPQYAGHHVIIAPHAYIDAFGSLDDPTWEAQLGTFIGGLTPLMDQYSSRVFLTLNGHFATECGYNTPSMINKRNELMFDRQDCSDDPGEPTGRGTDDPPADHTDRVGGATITILTLSPETNEINVSTFDLYKGEWRDGPTEQYTVNMFSIPPKIEKQAAR